MSSLQIGRLVIGPPQQWTEGTGDPVAALGGAVVPAQRAAPQFQLQLATWAADGNTDTLAARLTLRRQLRSLLNNSPLKLAMFLYIVWSDDLEQDGWYVPDQGPLTDLTAPVGLATGLWQLQQPWYKAGAQRTHREARQVWMKDLRTGLYARDTLGWLVGSTDFSALPALMLTVTPSGALNPANTVSGQVAAVQVLPIGRDVGRCALCVGLPDLTVISYERAESQLNLSDVIVYDRRGNLGPFGSGGAYDSAAGLLNPQSAYGWEEVYGPDYPWSWLAASPTLDAPVVENGLVRVRYDTVNVIGFRVDAWNGSTYVEQGKMIISRTGDVGGLCNTWVSANLVEYTPERAVIEVVLLNSNDGYSRERIFITVQRGELGVTFECYPALKAAGTQADSWLSWTPALNSGAADLNASIAKIDSQAAPPPAGTAAFLASAGTGAGPGNSGLLPVGPTTVGAANFTSSQNWVCVLRYPTAYGVIGPYQTTLVVLQAANAVCQDQQSSAAYAVNNNQISIESQNGAGYLQVQVAFGATVSQQVMEAESMTLGTGTSNTADALASGGHAATATRTTDANPHASAATWPNGTAGAGSYRVFARVKTSAGTASFYAKTGATTGATRTSTSTTYTWIDLGTITANNTTFEIHAWTTSGTVSVDRIEAVLYSDVTRSGAIYSGANDQGSAALMDARQLGVIVAR